MLSLRNKGFLSWYIKIQLMLKGKNIHASPYICNGAIFKETPWLTIQDCRHFLIDLCKLTTQIKDINIFRKSIKITTKIRSLPISEKVCKNTNVNMF